MSTADAPEASSGNPKNDTPYRFSENART